LVIVRLYVVHELRWRPVSPSKDGNDSLNPIQVRFEGSAGSL
jgi:hypothetical protein